MYPTQYLSEQVGRLDAYGAGASYAITTNWAAQLEYQNYGKVTQNDVWGTGNSDAAKAYAISLSAKYSF